MRPRRPRAFGRVRAAARILGALAVLGVIVAAIAGFDAWHFLSRPIGGDAERTLVVQRGMSVADVGARLRAKNVFNAPREALYWRVYARASGAAARIKSGEYALAPGQTPRALLAELVAGRTVQRRLTLVPGRRFAQVLKKVASAPGLKHTLDQASPAAVMAAIGHPGQDPEGRFLPDTYLFPRGTTDVAFFKRAYAAMQDFVAQAWQHRANNAAVNSPYQALVLASIVEKETAAAGERARIAGVFNRRLQKGMRLQSDPTVIYGLDDFDGNLRRVDLDRDTPYNTYVNAGLPPSPIATPSRAAIRAALHPALGSALYFVARGNGRHVFSDTLAGQRAAIEKYQKTSS